MPAYSESALPRPQASGAPDVSDGHNLVFNLVKNAILKAFNEFRPHPAIVDDRRQARSFRDAHIVRWIAAETDAAAAGLSLEMYAQMSSISANAVAVSRTSYTSVTVKNRFHLLFRGVSSQPDVFGAARQSVSIFW
jgi:hypothetical protein